TRTDGAVTIQSMLHLERNRCVTGTGTEAAIRAGRVVAEPLGQQERLPVPDQRTARAEAQRLAADLIDGRVDHDQTAIRDGSLARQRATRVALQVVDGRDDPRGAVGERKVGVGVDQVTGQVDTPNRTAISRRRMNQYGDAIGRVANLKGGAWM